MINLHRNVFEIEEATVAIGDLELGVKKAVCYLERSIDYGQIVQREAHGDIQLHEEPPDDEDLWLRDNKIPRIFDNVEIENDVQRIRLESVVVPYPPTQSMEFIARNAEQDIKP